MAGDPKSEITQQHTPGRRPSVTGMFWYTPETYERIRALSVDAEGFRETFEEWLAEATRAQHRASLEGQRVIRVLVDPDELLSFCKATNAKVDARGRVNFASYKTAQKLLEERKRKSCQRD